MEKLVTPETVAGVCLALYFFVRGFATLFGKSDRDASVDRFQAISKEHATQDQAARERNIVSRQEFIEHQRELQLIKEKIETWDDAIHHGDFSCKWTRDEIVRLIDAFHRIEALLTRLK